MTERASTTTDGVIAIVQASEEDRQFCSDVNRAAYFNLISKLWGWDDERHQFYQDEEWKKQPPGIILYDDAPIGTVRLRRDDKGIEISQFCIFPEYQNGGIGTRVLRKILAEADESGIKTRLTVLHQNPAKTLYERHGFILVGHEDVFYFMEREVNGKTTGDTSPS